LDLKDAIAEVTKDMKLRSKFATNSLKIQRHVYQVMPISVREYFLITIILPKLSKVRRQVTVLIYETICSPATATLT